MAITRKPIDPFDDRHLGLIYLKLKIQIRALGETLYVHFPDNEIPKWAENIPLYETGATTNQCPWVLTLRIMRLKNGLDESEWLPMIKVYKANYECKNEGLILTWDESQLVWIWDVNELYQLIETIYEYKP